MSLTQPMSGGNTPARYAVQKLTKDASGNTILIYIDATTGMPIDGPIDQYTIISAGNEQNLPSLVGQTAPPVEDPEATEEESQTEKVLEYEGSGGNQNRYSSIQDDGQRSLTGRSSPNNFNYFDVPNNADLVSLIPGPIGTAGKVARVAASVNNSQARNSAREFLGLEKKNTIRQVLSDTFGLRDPSVVARVDIGNKPYSVGFEALDELGNTTLTPSEARTRSLISGNPLREIEEKDFSQRVPETQQKSKYAERGLLGNVKKGIGDVFNRVTGRDVRGPVTPVGDKTAFPDAPTSNSSSGGRGSSGSPGVSSAIDSGQGGLF